jgi:hypothetical protein
MKCETRKCHNCIHSIRVGTWKKINPSSSVYSIYESKLRCTYEPEWRDVSPSHYCGHYKLDSTQEFEIPLERYQAPVERRMDSDESL